MKNLHLMLASCSVVLLAAGCGGGGSSSGGGGGTTIPTAAVQITPTNAQAVAKGAATPAQGMAQSGGKLAGTIGVVAASGNQRSVLDISLANFAKVRGLKLPAPGVVGVISGFPMNQTCTVSGSMTMDVQDTNNNTQIDGGDVFAMSFASCNDGSTTDNGSMSFAITNLSGAMGGTGTPLAPLTATFTVTFSQFSSVDNVTGASDTISGDIAFTTSDDGTNTTGTMSGNSLSMDSSVDGPFQMSSYSISFTEANVPTLSSPFSFSFNMTTASVAAGGSIVITTSTPFTGTGNGDPTAGVMVITGANNSTLTLTAQPDGVHVQMVVDEDGTAGPIAPVTLTQTTWAAI